MLFRGKACDEGNDAEPEFSDDETERQHVQKTRAKNRNSSQQNSFNQPSGKSILLRIIIKTNLPFFNCHTLSKS